jgi:hypothetical protein
MSILNRMIKSETIPHAYEEWKDYREQVTGFIIKNCKKNNGGETAKPVMAVWGAGQSNDIDLAVLNHRFRLVLIDRDREAMETAVKRYNLNSDEVMCMDIPFWNIEAETYEMFEAMLREAVDCDAVAEYLYKLAFVNSGHNAMELKSSFDYSVCVGLHSQLNVRFAGLLYAYRNNYDSQELNLLENVIKKLNVNATERLNDIIYSLTSEAIIYGYELATVDIYDMKNIDIHGEDFTDRVEGALQLQGDIALHNGYDIRIIDIDRMLWPFQTSSLNKGYVMELVATEKLN